jgi:deoxyribodipyrimidine photo-lyase
MKKSVSICWLRRDLRLDDNAALYYALKESEAVLPLFIFDSEILEKLEDLTDKRVQFIHEQLVEIKSVLSKQDSDIIVKYIPIMILSLMHRNETGKFRPY